MPKVSVIIPVYNVEQYIERCARSLFEQTLDDLEYLFIDDCSTDNSIAVLNRVLEDFPLRKRQVIIHKMDVNSGQAKVREWGVRHANGEYTIHCDSDDYVDVDAYNSLYNYAVINKYDIVFHDFYETDGINSNIKRLDINSMSKEALISQIMIGNVKASLWMTLIDRNLYSKKYFSYPTHDMTEDYTTILQLLWLSDYFGYYDKPFYYYCYNSNSIARKISIDSCLKRYYDCVSNTSLLESFFTRQAPGKFREEIDIRKYATVNQLLPLIYKYNYYKKWRTTYPHLCCRLLNSHYLDKFGKVKILLIFFGLYPIYHFIKGYNFAVE